MLCGAIAFPQAVAAAQAADPADALYARRAHLPDAARAADHWAAALEKSPSDFDAAWKLARAGYWLGGHLGTEQARVRAFERGIAAGQKAIAARPQRPEGYFWVAANMGGLAELKGLRAGLRYRTPIRQHLEKVLALDPGFQKGSADRALGRWYYKVPGLFGGSKKKSEEHLRRSLTYHPDSIASRYFLAETYEAMNRDADAVRILREIEAIAIDPEWAPEDAEFKQKARAFLARLKR
jgi:tetratricopeptide (TPR) repeat protein